MKDDRVQCSKKFFDELDLFDIKEKNIFKELGSRIFNFNSGNNFLELIDAFKIDRVIDDSSVIDDEAPPTLIKLDHLFRFIEHSQIINSGCENIT